MQSRDRQVAGVKLSLSGNCWTSLVDPKLPFTTVANGRDEWKRELGRQPPTLEAGPGVQ
jgi:hypothetical protein